MSTKLDDDLTRLRANVTARYLEARVGWVNRATVRSMLERQSMEATYGALRAQLDTATHRWLSALRRMWGGR